MYLVEQISVDELSELEKNNYDQTIFQTSLWIQFLIIDQNIKPVILKIYENEDLKGVFVGGIIKKFGIKILGSPFEGWLTPDMGFIDINNLNFMEAISSVKKYAFNNLNVHFIRIISKNINDNDVSELDNIYYSKTLVLDLKKNSEELLKSFTKRGRKSIRQSGRKGAIFKKVNFDDEFIDIYYNQLEDVFAKQRLKPFYGKRKLQNIASVFYENQQYIDAFVAYSPDNEPIASRFSFIYNNWAYGMGSASYREFQRYLPNEGLYWNFLNNCLEKEVEFLDMVGYRNYKLKYNPELKEVPVIILEKYPGLIKLQDLAKRLVVLARNIKGRFK